MVIKKMYPWGLCLFVGVYLGVLPQYVMGEATLESERYGVIDDCTDFLLDEDHDGYPDILVIRGYYHSQIVQPYRLKAVLANRDNIPLMITEAKGLAAEGGGNPLEIRFSIDQLKNSALQGPFRLNELVLDFPEHGTIAQQNLHATAAYILNKRIDHYSTRNVGMDKVIELSLLSGGSYQTVEKAEGYLMMADLIDFFDRNNSADNHPIPLPFEVQVYRAAEERKGLPVFLVTPKKFGILTFKVATKGNFIPNIKIDGVGAQRAYGNSIFGLSLEVMPDKTYQISVEKPQTASGLYSVVASFDAPDF